MIGTQRQLVPVSLPSGWDADDTKFDLAHQSMIEGMQQNGYVWFKQSSHSVAMRLLKLLGEPIYEEHVKEDLESTSFLKKKGPLAPHTDHHYADFIMWYVHDHCDEGGETRLYPTREILKERDKRMLSWVRSLKCEEHKAFKGDPGIWPVIQWSPDSIIVEGGPGTLYRDVSQRLWYYSYWLADRTSGNVEKAFKLLQARIEQMNPLRGHLKKGDIFIFDNRLNLHARTEYFNSKRHLERHWVKAIL